MTATTLPTSHKTAVTSDDLAGLRRKTSASTLLHDPVGKHSVQGESDNTSLAGVKPGLQTRLRAGDLSGFRAKKPAGSQHDRLTKQAQTLVSQAFFGTLMKQMRESPFRSELFDGGRGGQAFGELYDQQLTERMSRGAGAHLVNAIVHRLEARANTVRSQIKPLSPRMLATATPAITAAERNSR